MMPAARALFALAALGGLPFGRGDRRLFLTLPALDRSAALAALVGGSFRVPFGTLFLAAALGGLQLCLGAALSAASAAAPASASPAATALTRNTALNRARKKSGGSEELSGDLPSAEPTPEERLLQQERRQALERALTALPQRDRLLFYRKYYYRQSTAQIAAELGTTERAVEGRLYRIKKALRKALGGDDA